MNHTVAVHILQANHNAGNEKLSLLLGKTLLFIVMVSEITTGYQISHKVDVLEVGKRIKHVDQESKILHRPGLILILNKYFKQSYTYGCFNCESSLRSLITEFTDFLFTIRTLDISFMAYIDLNFLRSTFQTRPKPPFPTTQWNLKWVLLIAI